MPKNKEELMFALPLRRFVEYYVSTLDKRQITYDDAIVIAAIDKLEQFCHIQFEDLETGKKLDKPLLWNKNDWLSNYEVHKHKKKNSAIERIKWSLAKENLAVVSKKLVELYYLDEVSANRAAELIIKKNNPKALANLGVKLDIFSDDMLPKDYII